MLRRALTTMLLIALCLPGTGQADDAFKYPATRAGELARRYIEALNSGNAETLEAFYREFYAAASLAQRDPVARAQRALGLHGQVGRIAPALVSAENRASLTITAHAAQADMWLSCKFTIEAQTPHKIVSVMMMPGAAPEPSGEEAEWGTLAELLEQVRAKAGVPALAAAIVEDGRVVEVAVVGYRKAGNDQQAHTDDCFHIGSITKSITATMVGCLVAEGMLQWRTTVGEVFGDMTIGDAYRDVTVEELLQHRSGLPGYLTFDDAEDARLRSLPGSPTRQREAFVAEVLQSEPIAEKGTAMNYSNAGYVVVGLMAERATGKSWRELVRQYVLAPAGMKQTGFGWPATAERPDQPRGHFPHGDALRPQKIGEYPLGDFLAPAGDMHASIRDLAKFAQLHLHGLAGGEVAISPDAIRALHTPPTSGAEPGYAGGWMVVNRPELGEVHMHSGSAGTFFATIELYPASNRAIVVATNAGNGAGAIEEIIRRVNRGASVGTR